MLSIQAHVQLSLLLVYIHSDSSKFMLCIFNTFPCLFCRKNKPSNAFMVSKVASKCGVCQVEWKLLLLEFYEVLEDIIHAVLFFILSDHMEWPHTTAKPQKGDDPSPFMGNSTITY